MYLLQFPIIKQLVLLYILLYHLLKKIKLSIPGACTSEWIHCTKTGPTFPKESRLRFCDSPSNGRPCRPFDKKSTMEYSPQASAPNRHPRGTFPPA